MSDALGEIGYSSGWRVQPLGDGWAWSAFGPSESAGGWKPTKEQATVVAQAHEARFARKALRCRNQRWPVNSDG